MLNTEDDVSKKNLFGAAFFGWYQHPASNEGVSTKKIEIKNQRATYGCVKHGSNLMEVVYYANFN